jgi:hypothetical protein
MKNRKKTSMPLSMFSSPEQTQIWNTLQPLNPCGEHGVGTVGSAGAQGVGDSGMTRNRRVVGSTGVRCTGLSMAGSAGARDARDLVSGGRGMASLAGGAVQGTQHSGISQGARRRGLGATGSEV